ncbi:MAG: succinate dehydrogenase [Pseudomonadota bacterium]
MRFWTAGAVVLLSACGAAQDAADVVARDRAKLVVNSVVQDRFPGVDPAPVTDCIIDAASAGEILQIASASVSGVTASTVETVLEIGTRPESVSCLSRNVPRILGPLLAV